MLRDRQSSSSNTFSSLTSRNCSRTAITLSSCNGALVSWMNSLCLASRHNAQQGVGIVDHLLLHGLSVSLHGFLFEVILVHDGSVRLAHNLRHHHQLGTSRYVSGHLCQDLRHENGDLLDVVWRVHRRLLPWSHNPWSPPPCETLTSHVECCWAHCLWRWCAVVRGL